MFGIAKPSLSVQNVIPSAPQLSSCAGVPRRDVKVPIGLPLFCEKPIATTLDDAVSVVQATQRAGVPLQVGFQRRFDPGFHELRASITSRDLGALYSITLTSHDATPPSKAFAAESGGMFLDLRVHDFDLVRWLTGDEVAEAFTGPARRGPADYLDALGDVDTTAECAARNRTSDNVRPRAGDRAQRSRWDDCPSHRGPCG
jgi:predicted dehydrogenase